MTAAPTARSPWFLSTRPAPSAPIRLFCLPPAGGGASTFRRWGAALGELVDVRAVALPGREARISERPEIDIRRSLTRYAPTSIGRTPSSDTPWAVASDSRSFASFAVAAPSCRWL